jgi:LysR family transcriptional activator for leuABCD operon
MICTMFNLRGVDLNLLPVFEAAYEERSLSRAADRLALTQPAVSHAMNRLRALFRDELFIRRSRGVQPTPVADQVYARLRGALASVREAVVETRGFDPATSERRFFVSIPHPLGPMMAVRLRERLARAAPRVGVAFSTRSRPIDQDRGLREGRLDAAIDWLVPVGGTMRERVVFDDGLAIMARSGHPALRYRSREQVVRNAEFVSLRTRVEGEHPVPALREWQRLPIRVALEVSEFVEVLMVAGGSDLLALVPFSMERVARGPFALRPVAAMGRVAPIAVKMIWHPARDRDPAHAFLRRELAIAVTDVARGKEGKPRRIGREGQPIG